jgi:hypothetical protein
MVNSRFTTPTPAVAAIEAEADWNPAFWKMVGA